MSILNLIALLLLLTTCQGGDYNYGDVLGKSILFYEAQRCGKLPSSNRISWRGDSFLNDAGDAKVDLTGGYFDAGDLVKFGLPLAEALYYLAWGLIDHRNGYQIAGQLENGLQTLKWGTDYLIKAHPSRNEFYCNVGNISLDHNTWKRPEDWPSTGPSRPAYKLSPSKPGSEVAAQSAAALAAASMVFRKDGKANYAKILLQHAQELYKFANTYRGKYDDSFPEVKCCYPSLGYGYILANGAAWLYRASQKQFYRNEVEKHFTEFNLGEANGEYASFQILMAQLKGGQKYLDLAKQFCDYTFKERKRTPKGLVYLAKWGSLSYASRASFLCIQTGLTGVNQKEYNLFAKQQIDYMLGDSGRSFVIGFGNNPPLRPHHRPSSCPSPPEKCDWSTFHGKEPNPHVLTGGLVGGPDENDGYQDDRTDYEQNEVSLLYNSAFQSTLAALTNLKDKKQI